MPGAALEDYAAPLFIAWQITAACNLECLHCCEESGHRMPDEMTSEQVLGLCSQIVDLDIPYVAISGGEPLLHPDFFRVCEFLRAHDRSVKVETNGLFITKAVAKRLAGLGFRSIQVSVDGAKAATHERLRGTRDWEKTIAACRYLVREGVNTEIVFVPTRFNIGEVGQVIDLAASLGIFGVYTGKIMRIGRAAKNWEAISPRAEDYEPFFKTLEEKTAEYAGKMKVYYYPYDVIEELRYRLESPAASLLVLPNGKVKLIGPLPFVCGDLTRQSLEEVWQRYKRSWKLPTVIEYARKVIARPSLLAESNRWVELS